MMDNFEILAWRAMIPTLDRLCGKFHPITAAAVRAADGQEEGAKLFWSEFMRLTPNTAEAIERHFKKSTNALLAVMESAAQRKERDPK